MKAVILAGGMGTRLAEETSVRPKPMIEIGGKPLLWHIMQTYSLHGVDDFLVCLGYRGDFIKDYFLNYHALNADITVDLGAGTHTFHKRAAEPWRVTLVDTGIDTMTGGRLKRIRPWLGDETFCMTYGDGLANVDITGLIARHRAQGLLATVTAVEPPGRFGVLQLDSAGERVEAFTEKPHDELGWINGGFFVLEPGAIDTVEDDETIWEREPMEKLAAGGQLASFQHRGFWQPCDTLRDKLVLENAWNEGAPWLSRP